MTAIQLLFLTIISIIAICDGFILPKESNENLNPADLLLNSVSLIEDLRGIDDLKRVERSEESGRDIIAPNTLLDEDYLRGMDDFKRVERSPSTSNKSSASSDSNKSSANQGNSDRNSVGSDGNARKDGSNSDKSSSNQSSKSNSNNKEKSQDNSKDNSGDNTSKNSKDGDDGSGDENSIKSKLQDLLTVPNSMKEAFERVFKLFSKGDDGGNNNGGFDLFKIPELLNKFKGLFGG